MIIKLSCYHGNHVEMVVVRVTDCDVASVQVDLPGHFLGTTQFHLCKTQQFDLNLIC